MFAEPCNPADPERAAATAAMREYVGAIVRALFPGADCEAMGTVVWALVHALAFLQLDGKLGPVEPGAVSADPADPAVMDGRVRAAVGALLGTVRR